MSKWPSGMRTILLCSVTPHSLLADPIFFRLMALCQLACSTVRQSSGYLMMGFYHFVMQVHLPYVLISPVPSFFRCFLLFRAALTRLLWILCLHSRCVSRSSPLARLT